MLIRKVLNSDIDPIVRIYNHYIATTTISFEEQARKYRGDDQPRRKCVEFGAALDCLKNKTVK